MRAGTGRARSAAFRLRFLAVLVLLIAVFVFFALTQARFFTSGNIDALLTSGSILWMVAIGLTFVMLTGGFDLSLGSLLALSGIAMGTFVTQWGVPVGWAIAMTVAFGVLVGMVGNGFLIGKVGLPFLVVTLGTLTLYSGLVNLWSAEVDHRGPLERADRDRVQQRARRPGVGLDHGRRLAGRAVRAAQHLLRPRRLRRRRQRRRGAALGHARARTLIAVYAIAGGLAGVAGVLQVARIGAASPQVGGTVIFDAAAAVLLGGTSFAGGVGGVGGTAIGVLFLATLQNGLSVSGVADYWQQIISGGILIVVVTLDRVQRGGLSACGCGRC